GRSWSDPGCQVAGFDPKLKNRKRAPKRPSGRRASPLGKARGGTQLLPANRVNRFPVLVAFSVVGKRQLSIHINIMFEC
ncbi:MAG: hypothetical protein V4463_07610, partial [Pseudomonadota bacterium]